MFVTKVKMSSVNVIISEVIIFEDFCFLNLIIIRSKLYPTRVNVAFGEVKRSLLITQSYKQLCECSDQYSCVEFY